MNRSLTSAYNWDLARELWLEQYAPFERASTLIFRICNPFMCVSGMFGNLMITLIMLRLPESTSSVLFQVLACSDQIILIMNPLMDWISTGLDVVAVYKLGSWQCKLYYMMVYSTAAQSAWMVSALTMLRAASVMWPLRVNAVWTNRMSRLTAGALVLAAVLFHAHFLYGFDIGPCPWKCCFTAVSQTYVWFYLNVWSVVDMVECCFLPSVLLVISNSVLVWKVVKSLTANKRLSMQQASHDSRQEKVSSLTVTLIVVSVCFFFLTTPVTLLSVLKPYIDFDDPIQNGQNVLFRAMGNVLWYANSSINFYLYCLTGAKFRAEFQNILFKCLFPGSKSLN